MEVDDEIDPDLIEDDEEINDAHASSPPKKHPSPMNSSTSSEAGSDVNSEDEGPSLTTKTLLTSSLPSWQQTNVTSLSARRSTRSSTKIGYVTYSQLSTCSLSSLASLQET